jgi:hypothetical protein
MIYSWGDILSELTDFIQYGLFPSEILHQINHIDVQQHFKIWYNKTFTHECDLLPFDDDNMLCTCSHRPVKNKNDQWSLQKAIAYTFDEFINKNRTKSHWSRCLDVVNSHQRFSIINRKQKKILEELILYAVNDCLAVTKLLAIIEFIYMEEQYEEQESENSSH